MRILALFLSIFLSNSWAATSGTGGTVGGSSGGGGTEGGLDAGGGTAGGSTSGGSTTGGGSTSGGASAIASTGYRFPPGSSQYIHAFGLCGTVTNNFSTDLFVSINSEKEWKTVLSAASPNISITRSACSCKSLLAMGNVFTGTYTADADGPGPLAPYQVYCDMDTDGGGWTLLGRSASGGTSSSFGWQSSTGSVGDDTQPYSLGIVPASVDVNEVLIGDYSSGKTWGLYIYKKPIPKDYFTTYAHSSIYTGAPTPVRGGNPNFGMAGHIGHTYHTDLFHFRDIPEDSTYGLQPGGWSTAYGNDYGGNLLGVQGMLMIR
jgi:hypothetical protein